MRINRLCNVIVLIVVIFISCDTEKKSSEEAKKTPERTEKFQYQIKKLSKKTADCQPDACTKVNVTYPLFDEENKEAKQVNETILERIKITLADFIMEADGDEAVDELATMFLENYRRFKESFPESQTPWYVEMEVMVSATTPHYLSVAFNTSSYTGGAHSNTVIEYLNLTPTGKKLDKLEDFFHDTEKLTVMAEEQFRRKYELSPDEPLSEKGFIFDNNEFELSENFGFTESAIIFYYNSYEIAPYSQGPTALLIPLSNLKELYKF